MSEDDGEEEEEEEEDGGGGGGDDHPHADDNNMEDESTDARSALFRVREKLLGVCDDGLVRGAEGQASSLLSEATDVSRLALMFGGWVAWS